LCLNNVYDMDVQTIQINEWHPCLFHMNLWKIDFARLLFFKSWPMKFVMQGQLVFKNLRLLQSCYYHVHNHFHLHTQNIILQHFCFIIFLPNFVVLHAYWKIHPTIIQGFHNFTFLKYLHPIIHLLFICILHFMGGSKFFKEYQNIITVSPFLYSFT
jgi:hypothetical protein